MYKFSITDLAWEYLKELPPHIHRTRPESLFDGVSFIPQSKETSARGLSDYLANFLLNPNPLVPYPRFYSKVKPFQILPQSFIDMRAHRLDDYAFYGEPGSPPYSESLMPHRVPDSNSTYYDYTTWSNGDIPRQRNLQLLPDLIPIMSLITYYWHISLSRPPKSAGEAASAFLNALGLGYLRHPLLPPYRQTTPGVDHDLI